MSDKLASAYEIVDDNEKLRDYTIAVLVDNEFGVLGRVIGLFSSRGYNIQSLTVSEIDHKAHLSRITIVTEATKTKIKLISSLLERLIPVHRVQNLTNEGTMIERGVALVKIINDDADARHKAQEEADHFGARTVDSTPNSFIFDISDTPENINHFIQRLKPLGIAEISRTGSTAMAKGLSTLHED